MKKRLLALGIIGVMTLSLVACGEKKEEATEEKAAAESAETAKTAAADALDCTYDVNDYVTLGDYSGVEVTLDGNYEFTEEGFEDYLNSQITSAVGYMKDEAATEVKADSIVNVDYVGSQDGVAFDGGSAEDQMLDVANNSSTSGSGFIDGFTAGLPGHKVGEEVAYEVTFPENYGAENLAGQTVIFTFQINYVAKKADLDSITDENVNTYFSDYTTVADFKAGMEENYRNQLEETKKSDTSDAVVSAVYANATVSGYPENLVQARIDSYITMMESYLNGYTFEEYVTSSGSDYDAYMEQMKSSIVDAVKQQMVFEAIAATEGLSIDQTKYDEYISNVMTYNNLTDESAFYANYSIGNLDGKDYFKTIYLADQAIEFCVDNAIVNY